MESFKEAYYRVNESGGVVDAVSRADQYVDRVESAIADTVEKIKQIGGTEKDIYYVKGDIAEAWHAGTLTIDATAKGIKDIRAIVPRDTGVTDIAVVTPSEFLQAQLKYYKTAEDTVKAISHPKYEGMIKVVPFDQLSDVRDAAHRLYLKNLESRPEQAQQYLDTYRSATHELSVGRAHGRGLSDPEALRIAKEIKKEVFDPAKHGLVPENFIHIADIARESGEAALNAALISAVLRSAPHLWKTISQYLDEGSISVEKLLDSGQDVLGSSGESALRGGMAAAITASCRSGLLGESLKSVSPNVVAAATVVATNAFKNALRLKRGEISQADFADGCMRDAFVVSFGVLGAGVAQTLIPVPILGALIGNFIGSLTGIVVYEGSKRVLFSFFINHDLSFFCIVNQNYEIPEDVLKQCGIELITPERMALERVDVHRTDIERIDMDAVDIKLLSRGIIAVNVIGYTL